MSNSNKKQKANVNKGYPRWVSEKYGSTPKSDMAESRVSPVTNDNEESERRKVEPTPLEHAKELAEQDENIPTSPETDQDSKQDNQNSLPLKATLPAIVESKAQDELSTIVNAPNMADGAEHNPPEKGEKRSEPQNIAEFIDAFLSGKAKALSEAVSRRVRSASPSIGPSVRGELLRRAQETDGSLDKTRKLMLLVKELASHKALFFTVTEFCIDCVLMNPYVQSEGMKPLLFPGHHDEGGLDAAWRKLQSLTLPSKASANLADIAEDTQSSDEKISLDGAQKGSESGGENAKNATAKSSAQRAIVTFANRARRNALMCSVIWRVQQGHVSFPEVMRELRVTLFSLKKRPSSLEDDLLEAIASVPEKEDERIAYLLEWNARQQAEAINRLSDASRRAEALSLELDALKAKLASTEEKAESLQTQLEMERNARAASEKALGVAETHGQADLEELRALSLKALRDAVSQLDVVSEALKRQPPKVESALDKVGAVMDALKETNKKLEEA